MSDHRLVQVRPLNRLGDERGWFLKILQERHLDGLAFGETYLAVGSPGEVRGSHYHERTTEWFCPVQGRGTLYLYDPSSGARESIAMDVGAPVSVRVPPKIAHALVADQGVEFATLAVADVEYDPEDNDTFAIDVAEIRGDGT